MSYTINELYDFSNKTGKYVGTENCSLVTYKSLNFDDDFKTELMSRDDYMEYNNDKDNYTIFSVKDFDNCHKFEDIDGKYFYLNFVF